MKDTNGWYNWIRCYMGQCKHINKDNYKEICSVVFINYKVLFNNNEEPDFFAKQIILSDMLECCKSKAWDIAETFTFNSSSANSSSFKEELTELKDSVNSLYESYAVLENYKNSMNKNHNSYIKKKEKEEMENGVRKTSGISEEK